MGCGPLCPGMGGSNNGFIEENSVFLYKFGFVLPPHGLTCMKNWSFIEDRCRWEVTKGLTVHANVEGGEM